MGLIKSEMPSVYLKTFGCQMNERDSEAIAAQLLESGFSLAEEENQADIILLNTCSVRDAAEQKAIGKMKALAGQTRRRQPQVLLGFMGCMAQARGQLLFDQIPQLNLVVGTQKFHRTAGHLRTLLERPHEKICDIAEEAGSESTIRQHLPAEHKSKSVTAFVSIMQGCNQHCTFCIVPQTRGMERSRPIPEIVAECQELAQQGVKEIILLGQIVTSYGRRDLPLRDGQSPFVQLLGAVHEVPELERIRFTAPHPKGYGDDLVEAYGRLPKLCESAHLPVQSGSDRILKLMHRGYTRDRFLEIIQKLRVVQPLMGLTTDIIVGFPGETESDFQETVDLVRTVRFDNVFLFKYSPRQGTPAASLPGQLETEEKERRHAELFALINETASHKYAACLGRRMQILVEGPSRKNPARLEGRTRCNKIVVFDGSDRHRSKLLDVKITRAGKFTLYGDPAWINLD